MNLRDLDERLLPVLVRAAQRSAGRLSRLTGIRVSSRPESAEAPAGRTLTRAPVARSKAPTGPAPFIVRLRAVDDRWTRSGPLALFREVPQLVGLALGLLLLVGGATVMQRDRARELPSDPASVDGEPPAQEEPVADDVVGPVLGDDVATYLQLARATLTRRAADEPTDRSIAIVHFDAYLYAEDAYASVRALNPIAAVFRIPPRPGEQSLPIVVRTRRFLKDLRAQYLRLAGEMAREVRDAESSAATTDDPAFKADYLARARQLKTQIGQLRGRCRCVLAAVVIAPNSDLLAAARGAHVRGVDLGPVGVSVERLTFQGLLPEEKVTVTGGNEG